MPLPPITVRRNRTSPSTCAQRTQGGRRRYPMSDLMSLVQRMEAFALGHAARITSHRHVAIQPHALVLAPIVMAGEETDIHMASVSRIGAPARIRYVADPRQRDDLYARIISWLNRIVDPYFQWRLEHNTYPQLWVSSSAAAKLIDILSDRLRYARTPEAERLGHLLTYPGERQHHDGQQTLMAATRALRLHVAMGQHVGEDEHLAVLLTWIDPPRGVPIWDAVARAEGQPSGIKTDPAFDRLVLARLVQAYNKARRAHAPASALDARAHAIGTALVPTGQPPCAAETASPARVAAWTDTSSRAASRTCSERARPRVGSASSSTSSPPSVSCVRAWAMRSIGPTTRGWASRSPLT